MILEDSPPVQVGVVDLIKSRSSATRRRIEGVAAVRWCRSLHREHSCALALFRALIHLSMNRFACAALAALAWNSFCQYFSFIVPSGLMLATEP